MPHPHPIQWINTTPIYCGNVCILANSHSEFTLEEDTGSLDNVCKSMLLGIHSPEGVKKDEWINTLSEALVVRNSTLFFSNPTSDIATDCITAMFVLIYADICLEKIIHAVLFMEMHISHIFEKLRHTATVSDGRRQPADDSLQLSCSVSPWQPWGEVYRTSQSGVSSKASGEALRNLEFLQVCWETRRGMVLLRYFVHW